MKHPFVKSPETVQVLPHPIHGDWTLLILGDPLDRCFCRWSVDRLGDAIAYASAHFARVIVPPRPTPEPGLLAALRQIGLILFSAPAPTTPVV